MSPEAHTNPLNSQFQERKQPIDLQIRRIGEMTNTSIGEAVQADVRKRMSRPRWHSVSRISEELGIHVVNL